VKAPQNNPENDIYKNGDTTAMGPIKSFLSLDSVRFVIIFILYETQLIELMVFFNINSALNKMVS